MNRKKIINAILDYFYFRKIQHKKFEIIKVGFLEESEKVVIYITLKKVGLLIGKKGWRIEEMQDFVSEKLGCVVDLQVIEHKEWFYIEKNEESSKMDWKKYGD